MLRRCPKCGKKKELNPVNFYRKHTGIDGFDRQCKECRKKYYAKRYKRDRDKILARKAARYKQKKERE